MHRHRSLVLPVAFSAFFIFFGVVFSAAGDMAGGTGRTPAWNRPSGEPAVAEALLRWTDGNPRLWSAVQIARIVAGGTDPRAADSTDFGESNHRAVQSSAPNTHGVLPSMTRLYTGGPNPLKSSTAIRFDLHEPGPVTLGIYDLQGRLVRMLLDGQCAAGCHTVGWDGRDGSSVPLDAGTYFCHMVVGGRRQTAKLVLLD